jgi:threonine synthase
MDAADAGRTYATHLWHPLFQAGTETFAFEVWEQLGRRAPEMVIAPVGAGSLLLGVWNGFRRLRAAGLVATVPRLFGVQAASCAPLAEAAIGPRAKPLPSGVAGPAEGIRVTDPPRGPAVVAATRESGGSVVSVADEFIWSAHRALAKAGVYAEPTAAVAFAGHRALRSEGMIDPAETAVVAITGLGLKTTSAIRSRRESEREVLA